MQQRFKNKPRKFVTHFHTEVFLHHGERSLYGSCGVQSETTSAKVQWNESEDAKMPITKSVHSKRYIGQESIFGLLNFFTFDFVFFSICGKRNCSATHKKSSRLSIKIAIDRFFHS